MGKIQINSKEFELLQDEDKALQAEKRKKIKKSKKDGQRKLKYNTE